MSEQIKALRQRLPDLPEIVLINRDVPTHELVELYRQADAVVLPTRGEGFNLPAAEALAAGAPLIVTGYSGQVDFAGPDVARQVDFRFAPSRSHVSSDGSVWVDPDMDDLAVAMREVFDGAHDAEAWTSIAERTERGRRIAALLGDAGQWASRIRTIAVDLLIAGKQNPDRSPTVAWVSSWNVACGIATYSNYLLERYPDAARDVVVLCDERTAPEQAGGEGKPAARVAWRLGDPTSAARIAREVAALGANTVVIQHQMGLIPSDVLTALLLDERLSGRDVILVFHNLTEIVESEHWEALRNAFRRVSRLIVHRVADLNLLKDWGLIDNVTLFPHGALRPTIARRPARDLSSGSAAPVVGAYGFFFRDKGFDVLIEAFARIRRQWPAAQLRMVTAEHPNPDSGAEIARCRALAQALGVDGAIEWSTQYLSDDESLSLLNGCDLLVLPRRETSELASGSARVAMASRAPVMVTPVQIFNDLGETVIRAAGLDASRARRLDGRGVPRQGPAGSDCRSRRSVARGARLGALERTASRDDLRPRHQSAVRPRQRQAVSAQPTHRESTGAPGASPLQAGRWGDTEPADGEDYVRWAYRLLLGREPENEAAVKDNPYKHDRQKLVELILNSAEFKSRYKELASVPAESPYALWEREAVGFVHLPKTGGTTFNAILASHFDETRVFPISSESLYSFSPAELTKYDLFSGHADYFSLNFIPRRRVRRISFFRDPVKRLISWYRYKKAHPVGGDFDMDFANRLAKEVTAEEFFEHPLNLGSPGVNNAYLFFFGASLSDRAVLNALNNEEGDDPGSDRDSFGPVGKALKQATERIIGLDAIGLTERFSESVESICAALGYPVPDAIPSAKVTDELPNSDSAFSRVPPVEMTPRLARALRRLTRYDEPLYQTAKREFERRLAARRHGNETDAIDARI